MFVKRTLSQQCKEIKLEHKTNKRLIGDLIGLLCERKQNDEMKDYLHLFSLKELQ